MHSNNMKKYLMSGVAAITFVAALTSCTSHDFEPMTQAQIDKAKYDQAFIKYIGGQVDANQDWGFSTAGPAAARQTRSHDVNGNLWYQKWERPTNVTDAEKAKVIAEFSKKRENQQATDPINWTNYWVQQVYKGEAHYTAGNGEDVLGSNQMNKLIAYNANYEEEVRWPEHKTIIGGYEHVNNFNNGNNTTVYTDDVTKEKFIGTTLMVDMQVDAAHGSTQFGYHNSTDSKDHFEYIILEIDGSYYVGFDFYAQHPEGQEANKNMDVERDWIFNDWIVKISPAIPVGEKYDLKIIAEDISASDDSDFDFNDVVLEVKYGSPAKLKLTHAGGTLPLQINDKTEWEVHELFGVASNVMVNTGAGPNKPAVVIEDFNETINNAAEANTKIKLTVMKHGEWQTLTAIKGEPATKLAVSIDFQVLGEKKSIKQEYPLFVEWATNANFESKWWVKE